jgi:hypothetical protein
MQLILRRASVSRKGGPWQHEDYDVFDDDREVGRIYLVDGYAGNETWFWGVSFLLTNRKSYGHASSLDEAKLGSMPHSAQYVECGLALLVDCVGAVFVGLAVASCYVSLFGHGYLPSCAELSVATRSRICTGPHASSTPTRLVCRLGIR